jgi:primosomal protein N'
MFAEVVPVRRTPFGLDGFDYSFEEKADYRVGQLVYVPLRGHLTEAVIRTIKTDSAFAARAKAISRPVPVSLALPPACLELLTWVAERTFSSLPTVLHAWLGNLPKRFTQEKDEKLTRDSQTASERTSKTGSINAYWRTDHETALITRAKEALSQGQRVLILTPWMSRVRSFQTALPEAYELHGDLTDGAYFTSWSTFLVRESGCLISTRMGSWLAPAADLVLIDEPENDDHKQDEQAPRYDARRLASWSAKYAGTTAEGYGLTPPLHANTLAPDIDCPLLVHPFHPKGRSAIPCIQADTLLTLREHDGPKIIIHPIRGQAARLTCRDCGWQALCKRCQAPLSAEAERAICRNCGHNESLALSCPTCGGVDLGKAIPGIEALKRAWTKSEPETTIDWRDTTNELLEELIPQNALVVISLPHLFGGLTEDIRRTERRLIAIRRLMKRVADSQGTLLIQSSEEDLANWEAWKTGAGVQETYARELATRRLFQYPPTWRRVKCLIDGQESAVQAWVKQAKERLHDQGTVELPSKINFRRAGSSERWVVHALFSPEMSEAALVKLLQPLAKDALIDLDPIAFFK